MNSLHFPMLISLPIAEKIIFSYTEIHVEKRIYNGDLGSCIKSSLVQRYLRMETTVRNYLLTMDLLTATCCPKSCARELPSFLRSQNGWHGIHDAAVIVIWLVICSMLSHKGMLSGLLLAFAFALCSVMHPTKLTKAFLATVWYRLARDVQRISLHCRLHVTW